MGHLALGRSWETIHGCMQTEGGTLADLEDEWISICWWWTWKVSGFLSVGFHPRQWTRKYTSQKTEFPRDGKVFDISLVLDFKVWTLG